MGQPAQFIMPPEVIHVQRGINISIMQTHMTFYIYDNINQRLLKYLFRANMGYFYCSYEFDNWGNIVGYRGMEKMPDSYTESQPSYRPRTHVRLRYNEKNELVYFSDQDGNCWQQEWGVPFLFGSILKEIRVYHNRQTTRYFDHWKKLLGE